MADDPLLLLRDRVIQLENRQDRAEAKLARVIEVAQAMRDTVLRMRRKLKERADG